MRSLFRTLLAGLGLAVFLYACVREYEPAIRSNVNVVIVEGTLTDLPEPQFVTLSRSKSDPLTGQFGSQPLTGLVVEIVANADQVLVLKETLAGRYELPVGFRGTVGFRYQLRFHLTDGTRYESKPETLQAVPTIEKVYQKFNAQSLSKTRLNGYTAANEVFADFQDPVGVPNYYRWDWKLWEYQDWCLSGQYADRYCSTACWQIIYSYANAVFADTYSNGRTIVGRRVAQIPYHQARPGLVEIRQSSLTPEAYRYYKLFSEQTEANGTLTDAPPSAPVGNVRNLDNVRETVVGYFAASSVSRVYYWLDRTGNSGQPIGLFKALYGRQPLFSPLPGVPCVSDENRTPVKPEGWRE